MSMNGGLCCWADHAGSQRSPLTHGSLAPRCQGRASVLTDFASLRRDKAWEVGIGAACAASGWTCSAQADPASAHLAPSGLSVCLSFLSFWMNVLRSFIWGWPLVFVVYAKAVPPRWTCTLRSLYYVIFYPSLLFPCFDSPPPFSPEMLWLCTIWYNFFDREPEVQSISLSLCLTVS